MWKCFTLILHLAPVFYVMVLQLIVQLYTEHGLNQPSVGTPFTLRACQHVGHRKLGVQMTGGRAERLRRNENGTARTAWRQNVSRGWSRAEEMLSRRLFSTGAEVLIPPVSMSSFFFFCFVLFFRLLLLRDNGR